MKMLHRVIKYSSLLLFWFRYRDLTLAKKMAQYNIDVRDKLDIKKEGDYLNFTLSGNKIPVNNVYHLNRGIRKFIDMLNDKTVGVDVGGRPGEIRLSIDGTVLKVQSSSNVSAAHEVFIDRLYDLSFIGGDNVIIDIGMNVGYATLFFASSEHVAHVYSFEPFPATYSEAVVNVNLNPHLKHKITTANCGISDKSHAVSVPVFASGSLAASTSSFMFDSLKKNTANEHITIQLKDILEVIEEVKAKHPGQKLFLKIDCEGEEYSIIERLAASGRVKDAAAFLLEWHSKGPMPILNALNENGFVSLHLPRRAINCGMIYAFKA